jgi:hypothetical protein
MLENIMAPIKHRSRIDLLAAKEAPIVVILQRKRAKLFQVITVGTEKLWVNEGSWFRGVLYAMDSDVSWDSAATIVGESACGQILIRA